MADIIDRSTHRELIDLQRAVNGAFAALDGHARDVGKPGIEWTDEEKAEAARLRGVVQQAVVEKNRALQESGLPAEHGAFQASQALKDAAKSESEESAGE
ncbi:hypothetical protein [Streptomyces xiaopingdaonensis]|uniref:hypothetical protein n=1 Tax=Streptomyces xiaopingdaonensis TaxID=1565415 RepID=UPI0002FBD169|nr:hypothetical protein [Streptomyces xiaopingdaonensis]